MCNNAALVEANGHYSIVGDPAEGALVVSARKAGISAYIIKLDEIPFAAEQQYMATLHEGESEDVIYVNSSQERILMISQNQLRDGSV